MLSNEEHKHERILLGDLYEDKEISQVFVGPQMLPVLYISSIDQSTRGLPPMLI